MVDRTRPLSRHGLLRRVGPFAGAALAGFLTVPLPPSDVEHVPELVAAGALSAVIVAATLFVPWERLPARAQVAVPLAYFPVVGLLRQAEGGGSSGFAILLLLPVFWLALYGTRRELVVAVGAAAVTLVAPILLIGDPTYGPSEWRRAFLWAVVSALVGLSVQGLVAEVRRRNGELGEERRRVEAILENLGDGVVACDAEGRVNLLNRATRELYQLPAQPLAAGDWAQAGGVYRPDGLTPFPRAELPLVRALEGETVRGEEMSVLARDGRLRAVLASSQPILDYCDRRRGAVAVLHDITERKEAERLKDEFFALVSHELRTPLTSILGYLELLVEDELDPERAKLLSVVDRNARRLQRLVGDMLFIAQLEAGELPLERGRVDLSEVAEYSVEALEHRAHRRSIDLRLENERIPALDGDADRLGQVFDNLISNALKYTPEGGRVVVRVAAAPDRAVIEVEDSGIGIASDEQDRLFERFFRASTATERVIEGVGLGLTVVKAIVEGHGGTVSAESEEGVGTTFRVELPLTADLPAESDQREVMKT